MPEHPPPAPRHARYNIGRHRVALEAAGDAFDVRATMFPRSDEEVTHDLRFDTWAEASSWLHDLTVAEEERQADDEKDRTSNLKPKRTALTKAQQAYAERSAGRDRSFLDNVLPTATEAGDE